MILGDLLVNYLPFMVHDRYKIAIWCLEMAPNIIFRELSAFLNIFGFLTNYWTLAPLLYVEIFSNT